MITDIGIRSLIIVSDNAYDKDFLRTCWTIQIIRSVAILTVVIIVALSISFLQNHGIFSSESSYASATLPMALAISGIAFLIQGFESVNQHAYAKRMKFERIASVSIINILISTPLVIILSAFYPTIWALVFGLIAGSSIKLILSYWMFPGAAMRLCLKQNFSQEILSRGKWIFGHSTLTVLTLSVDKLMFGLILPASEFGVYHIARQFLDLPESLATKIHSAIGLQVFRRLQSPERRASFRDYYYRYRIFFDGFILTVCGGMLFGGTAVMDILYDPRYRDAGWMLQILSLSLLLVGPNLIRDAFGAQGRFQPPMIFSFVRMVSAWSGVATALLVFDDFPLALLVFALHRLPETLVTLYAASQEEWISLRREGRLLPLLLVGAGLGWCLDALWFHVLDGGAAL